MASTNHVHALDLDAYCERLGYGGAVAADLFTFEMLHLLHATRIPFENLTVQMGQVPALDLASLEAKLVRGHRGGYCFEQNALFAGVLEQLGFRVTRLLARVRLGIAPGRRVPRTHMLLLVEIAGEPWVADVGYGSWGLLQPLPLVADRVVRQHAWSYRLARERHLWVLQARRFGRWEDVYAFSLDPQEPEDFHAANYFIAQDPASRFVQTLTVQLPGPERRIGIRNREFVVAEEHGERIEPIESDEELKHILAKRFGLTVPADAKFRAFGNQA